MVVFDHSPPLKRELEPLCRSPKSLRFLPGFTTRHGLVSLVALAFGLALLLRHPGFESSAWKPNPVVSLVISDPDNTAVSSTPNLNHSLSAAGAPEEEEKHNDLESYNVGACNLTKGRWVDDEKRPLYTGEFCQRYLSQPWFCRRDKHRNLSYEHFRWQPNECDLPPFDAGNFLQRMTNKTIAFIGDSLGRQQFQSLICMLTRSGLIRASDISHTFRLRRGSAAYNFPSSNTTILYYWSTTLAEEEPKPDGFVHLHLDRVPAFLRNHIDRLNLVIINTGHHWNRMKMKANKWIPHLGGEPLVNHRISMGFFRQTSLDNCARWLSSESEKRDDLQVLVRSLSPRHFVGGEWDSGGRCDSFDSIAAQEREREFKVDVAAERAARDRVNVRVLEVGYMSSMRGEAHVGGIGEERQDCLHWCLPGVPDAWNELMFGLLVGETQG